MAKGATPIATWTKHVSGARFANVASPSFTTDGRYAFTLYTDEVAGRYPYDGGDVHAELVSVDVTNGKVRETPVPAQSRTATQKPARPGMPYPLQGSTVVWQAQTPTSDNGDVPVTLMQLDLSQPNAAPNVLRTIPLPPRSTRPTPSAVGDRDWPQTVIGASHGRVLIAQAYLADERTRADRLFLADADGAVRELGHYPTPGSVRAAFSSDGTRFAYETRNPDKRGGCTELQAVVLDSATGQPVAGFPAAPFPLTPKPLFFLEEQSAVWWTPDGRLRATGSADECPRGDSGPFPKPDVWEFSDSRWTQVDPPGTYRDYPLPDGTAVVVTDMTNPPPGQSALVKSLFIRRDGQLTHVAEAEATAVAVGPA